VSVRRPRLIGFFTNHQAGRRGRLPPTKEVTLSGVEGCTLYTFTPKQQPQKILIDFANLPIHLNSGKIDQTRRGM